MAEYQGLVDRATNVANQPYQPYQGEQVAPLSTQTQTGLGGISQYANAAQPYLGAAGAMTMGASAPVNPSQFQGMGSLANYMNPFTSSVVNATQGEMNNQNQQQAQFLNSANISSGAFGGDRAGIGQSILANQQQLAEAPTIAGLNQANYNQAMSNWQNQQGVNLAAQQANAARQMSGAAQLGSIGQSVQQAGTTGAEAQIQAGMIPQQQQQAIDTAAQNMYQTGQAYPFTTTGWLGNIIEGTGSLSGGQGTSQTTAPAPNAIGQGLGMASQGLGILGSLGMLSDVRAKENLEPVGKTYDGQNIYRYNYKGDPRTQIGLIAQEEAYHDPGSVQRVGMGDLLGIDYESATDEAAERGHFQGGGAAEMPPGGIPQGVTGGAQPAQPLSGQGVDYTMMMGGDPGARSGLGSMALLGGASMHPNPGFETVPLRPSGQAPNRQSFQGGGDVANPAGNVGSWSPGQEVGPASGIAAAIWEQASGASKNPYLGVDLTAPEAIGGGQWMPPQTNSPMPDWQNLQNSPQFGSAEAALSGMFGSPSASASGGSGGMGGPMPMGGADIPGGAGATYGGLSRGQLGDIASSYFGGGAGGGPAGGGGMGSSAGGFSYTPGSVPAGTNTLSQAPAAQPAKPAPAAPSAPTSGWVAIPNTAAGGGDSNMDSRGHTNAPIWEQVQFPTGASGPMGKWRGGEATMNNRASGGRAGFQGGGFPLNDPRISHYTPTTGNARGASYVPPQQVPPAIQIQRQLQGKARATEGVRRGIVRPRVIAPDPVTGQHHDITPFQQPDHPSTMRYPGWPTPGPGGSGAGASPDSIWPWGPTVRFGAKVPPDFIPPKEQGPENAGEEPRGPGPQAEPAGPRGPWGPRSASAPPEAEPPPRELLPAPESPGEFIGNLPGRIARATPFGRAISIGKQLLSPDPTSGPTGVELPRSLGRRPSGPSGPTINAPPPQSHVTDLGTWGDESPAPEPQHHWGPRHAGGTPTGPIIPDPPKWGGPPPADIDSQIMNMGDEGPQLFTGGRVGRQDGGASTNMPFPGQQDPSGTWAPPPPDYSKMSDADFGAALKDDMSSASPSDTGWIDKLDWGQHAADVPSASARPMASHIPPASLSGASSQPTFGGGGGGGYRGDVTSLMGGPPITAGHYVPTSGNARGATYVPGSPAISPNARAQAPEHPAITVARHIHAAGFAAGHAAGKKAAAGPPNINTSYGPQLPGEYDEYGYGIGVRRPGGGEWGGEGSSVPNYQGGGGVMGSSPMMNAGAYTPQGMGLTGQTSQGGGLGSIAAASGAAGGFGDLFGGSGRAGFAEGGDAGMDPLLTAIQASSGAGARMGPGPPQIQAPKAPEAPSGGQPSQPGSQSDPYGLSALGKAVKGLNMGVQTSPTGSDPNYSLTPQDAANMPNFSAADQSAMNDPNLLSGLTDEDLANAGFIPDTGFATGGGVGLGSLRGNFQDGGDAADAAVATDAPADDAAWDQAFIKDIKGAPGGSGNAPAPAPIGGGGGGVSADRRQTSPAQRAAFYRQYITSKYPGADPNVALGVAGAEGLNAPGVGGSTVDVEKETGQPFSFGDFQMNIHPGALGDQARKAGYDPADPNQWQGVGKFAIDQMYGGKGGLNLAPWKGDKYAAAYLQGEHPGVASASDKPSAGAMPVSADTTSYGGGFQLPGEPQPSRPPTMGDELKRDPWGYMMTVGAGMMASRSPFLGTMMGEGFTAGNKYLGQMQQLDKEWNVNQAQINNLSAEAREHNADAGLKVQQIQLNALAAKIRTQIMRDMGFNVGDDGNAVTGGAGGSGTGGGGLKPLPALGGGTGASGAPTGGAGPSGGGTGGAGPGATTVAGGPGATSGAPDVSTDPDWIRGKALIEEGNRLNMKGKYVGMEGAGQDKITQGEALVEGAEKRFEIAKAPYVKGTEAGAEADVKQTSEQDSSVREGLRSRPALTQRAEALIALLDSGFKPGMGADWKADVVRAIKAAGFNPAAVGLDPSQAANYQEYIKNSTAMVMDAVKAMPGTPRVAEITSYKQASPNAELEPEANRAILAQALGVLDYQDKYGQGYLKWRHGEGAKPTTLSLGDYDDKFVKENKIDDAVALRKARSGLRPPGLPSGKYSYDNQTGVWTNKATGKAYNYDGSPVQQ